MPLQMKTVRQIIEERDAEERQKAQKAQEAQEREKTRRRWVTVHITCLCGQETHVSVAVPETATTAQENSGTARQHRQGRRKECTFT